jgi:hypothetical protein
MCQLTLGNPLGSSPAGYREPYLVSWREEGAPTWHQQEQELLPGDMPTLRIGSCLYYLYLFKGTVSRDRFRKCLRKLTDLGLNKGRGWFLNFSEAPLIFG